MVKFNFKVDGNLVEFNSIPDSITKTVIADLIAALSARLESVECKVHHIEPTITAFFKGGSFNGFGTGACCQEFADTMLPLLKIKVPGFDPETPQVALRIVKYSDLS